jgi:tRNA pseudouridine13 synthase
VLDARFDGYDKVMPGDICRKDNGADFVVTDAVVEQPRADAFEISPTGPIFGYKMQMPEDQALTLEQEILAKAGLTLHSFDLGRGLSQKGDRRPLRFKMTDPEVAYEAGEKCLRLAFSLPKGCYATVVLKEVTKGEDPLEHNNNEATRDT